MNARILGQCTNPGSQEELGKLGLWWAGTIFVRPGGGDETVRQCPRLLQQLVWKQGETVLELTRLCFLRFNWFSFPAGGRCRNPTRCFKAQLETKLKTGHSYALLYWVFFAIAAVPNLVPECQFAWECLLLFSGSRLWRVSSKLSSKDWGALFNVSSVIYNGVVNCFPSYHFAWINICNEIGGFGFFWNGCLSTPPNSSPRAESLIL